jgi:predicted TIM-barrel fold metal-dependent hydrolase
MRPSEPGRPIPYLDRVALDFPELTIVAGHIGFPWTNEMISLATKYPNVYIDTSAYKTSRYPPELITYMRGHGRGKVMFGTNFPMIAFADALKNIDGLELDAEARRLFLFEMRSESSPCDRATSDGRRHPDDDSSLHL